MERSWEELIDIDTKKYLHIEYAQSELANYTFPVDKVEGCYIYIRGNKILDCMSQLYCTNIGQVNQKIQQAIKDSLNDFGFVWEAFLTKNRALATEQLMSLVEPDGWAGRCKFVSTGSEANEENFIIAKLYRNAPHIMTREGAYHGWTEGPGQATRIRRVRGALTSPTTDEIKDIPGFHMPGYYVTVPPYCYKCPLGQEYPDCKGQGPYGRSGMLACVEQTESLLRTIGPETFAAMITEIVMGAGTIVPPPEYIPQLTKMLKGLGILWIDDEVICGFGRTGKWFAYQHYPDVKPDLMTMGKGIVSSQLPAAGIVVSKEIAKFMEEWRWWHVSTYAAHPVAMAAVAANIQAMKDMKIIEHVNKMGELVENHLKRLEEKHKCVGLVAGMGMFWEIELVKNKKTKTLFIPEDRAYSYAGDMSKIPANIIMAKCIEKGVLCGGFVPNSIRYAPALIVNEKQIEESMEALDYAFTELDKMCD